jgi:hypothetical protein
MAMHTRDFCLERAAQCGRDAAASGLANVQERLLAAQGVWLDMADRIDRTARGRADIAVEKARATADAGKA